MAATTENTQQVSTNSDSLVIMMDGKRLPLNEDTIRLINSVLKQDKAPYTSSTNLAKPPKVNELETTNLKFDPLDWFRSLDLMNKVLMGIITLISMILAMYTLVIRPRQRRKPLVEAIALLYEDDAEQFKIAEELLDLALTNGLGRKDVFDAKFALTYVRARMNRFADAAAVLGGPKRSSDTDREAVYLDLWLQSQLENNDKVEEIYYSDAELLGDLLDTRLIAGKCLLNRARKHWDLKEIQGAIHYYEQLRQLQVEKLKDEIPAQIDDHQVVLGVQSLFQHDTSQARHFFDGAVSSAVDRKKSPVKGQLGLLICKWQSEELPDIDSELGNLLQDILTQTDEQAIRYGMCRCNKCGHEYRVKESYSGQKLYCSECHGGFKVEIEQLEEEQSAKIFGKQNEQPRVEAVTEKNDLTVGDGKKQLLGDYRVFTKNSGKKYSAKVTGIDGDKVTIKLKKNGKSIAVTISKFSPADHDYINNLSEQISALTLAKATSLANGSKVVNEKGKQEGRDETAADKNVDDVPFSARLPGDMLLNEADLLVRNVCLWHAASLLIQWHHLPEREGLPEEQLQIFHERIGRVTNFDPDMGDAQLMEGLITYYLAASETQRREGFGLIEKSTQHDVNLPEVLSLCAREKQMADLNEQSRDRFLQILEAYLHDHQVKKKHRDWLKTKLQGYSRFKSLDPDMIIDDTVPSTNDLRSRGALISSRVASVIERHLQDDSENIDSLKELVDKLDTAGQNIEQEAKKFEFAERGVLAYTGEFLLEEEITEDSSH